VRTYEIHLGSSNILVELEGQSLCLVPDRRPSDATPGNFLQFEGDRTLSVLVSKALLLADDIRVADATILS
jgi:hypothetical protein